MRREAIRRATYHSVCVERGAPRARRVRVRLYVAYVALAVATFLTGPGPAERILGLVRELDEPRVVRDYDAEIGGLLDRAGGAARARAVR